MASTPAPVLLCTDGSEASIDALAAGLSLLGPDLQPVVVTAADDPDPMLVTGSGFAGGTVSQAEFDRMIDEAQAEAKAVVTEVRDKLGLTGEGRIVNGPAGPAICRLAEELDARAVVLGSRGRGGLKRAVLGSVSDFVVRNAPCTVIVTPPGGLPEED